jgi:hypothetical protein
VPRNVDPTHKSSCYVAFTEVTKILSIKIAMISGFRRHVDEICALLGCYEASSGNPLPTLQDNVSVLSSRVSKSIGLLCS